MKSFLILSVCFSFIISTSFSQIDVKENQGIQQSSKDKIKGKFYISVGGTYVPSFALSSNLTKDGLSSLDKLTLFNSGIGTQFEYKRLLATLGISSLSSNKDEDTYKYRLRGVVNSLDLSYRFIQTNNIGFNVGLGASQTLSSFQILSKNTIQNLSTINPSNQTGAILLNYNPVNFRVNAGFSVIRDSSPLDIVFTYQQVINNAKWESDYAILSNSPSERGQSQFSVALRMYLFTKSR